MANFDSLPPEVQSLIFQRVDNAKQLGECRLVNKHWDKLAEYAMFSRQLCITGRNSTQLYMYLLRKPFLMLQLLVITPDIERILAVFLQDQIYQILVQMIQQSGMRLQRLKSIPVPSPFTQAYHQTALLLKDSLEEVMILGSRDGGFREIAHHLNEFKCLSKLRVEYCAFGDLSDVERIVRGVPHIKDITISNCRLNGEASLDWMEENVEISNNAITFRGSPKNQSKTFLIYFSYKFPNIRQFDFESFDDTLDVGIDAQACSRISRIPNYTINLGTQHKWKTQYRSFAGNKNTVFLYYGLRDVSAGVLQRNSISSTLEQDQGRITRFKFWTLKIFGDQPFNAHLNLLQDISAFTTYIHLDFSKFDSRTVFIFKENSRIFFKALTMMNHLEGMDFDGYSGILEAVELDLPPQYKKRLLNTLTISCTDIVPLAFLTLDRLFHTINELTLYFNRVPTNTMSIHLPSTALVTLGVSMSKEAVFALIGDQQISLVSSGVSYIVLILQQQNVTLYFKWGSPSSDIHQVAFAEYSKRLATDIMVSISCRMVEYIKFVDVMSRNSASIDVQQYLPAPDAPTTSIECVSQ